MLLPIALNLKDAPCLVVGGGEIGARKVRSLLDCGARVKVVSPQLCEALETMRADNEYSNLHKFEYSKRVFECRDCDQMRLVFACTNSRTINDEIARASQFFNALCNVADEPRDSDFQNMAVVRRGEITIAISTGGGSPALSKRLKTEIENAIGDEYAQLLELMSERRAQLNRAETSQSERAALWHRVLDSDVLELLRRGENESAAQLVDAIMFGEPRA